MNDTSTQRRVQQLEEQLRLKEKDVQLAATIGQDLLAQIQTLTLRVRELEVDPSKHTANTSASTSKSPNLIASPFQFPFPKTPTRRPSVKPIASSSLATHRLSSDSPVTSPVEDSFSLSAKSLLTQPRTPLIIRSKSQSQLLLDGAEVIPPSLTPAMSGTPKQSAKNGNSSNTPQMDPSLAAQIDSALVLQLRNLQSKTSTSESLRIKLEEKCELFERECSTLRTQNERLSASEGEQQSVYNYRSDPMFLRNLFLFALPAKLNERIWQLELTNQTMSTTTESLQKDLSRATSRLKLLERESQAAKDALDLLKQSTEKDHAESESRTENEAARKRREIAHLKREKALLERKVEELMQGANENMITLGEDGSFSLEGSAFNYDQTVGEGDKNSSFSAFRSSNTLNAGASRNAGFQSINYGSDSSQTPLFVTSLSKALDAAHAANDLLRAENSELNQNTRDLSRLLLEANEMIESLKQTCRDYEAWGVGIQSHAMGTDENAADDAAVDGAFFGSTSVYDPFDGSMVFDQSMMSLHDQIAMSSSTQNLVEGELEWNAGEIHQDGAGQLLLSDLDALEPVAVKDITEPEMDTSEVGMDISPAKQHLLEKDGSNATLMSAAETAAANASKSEPAEPPPQKLQPIMVDFCGQTDGYGFDQIQAPEHAANIIVNRSILHEMADFEASEAGPSAAHYLDHSHAVGISVTSSADTSLRSFARGTPDPNASNVTSQYTTNQNASAFIYYSGAAEREQWNSSRLIRHRSEVTFDHQTQEYVQYDGTAIEALTSTMIGTWFLKFNRHGRKPQLRFFWVCPYTRMLHWSRTASSTGTEQRTAKAVYIKDIRWSGQQGPPTATASVSDQINSVNWNKNYPPNETHAIEIVSNKRSIMMMPLNWNDHHSWISGLKLLMSKYNEEEEGTDAPKTGEVSAVPLRRERGEAPLHERFKIIDTTSTIPTDRRPLSRQSMGQPQRRCITPGPDLGSDSANSIARRRQYSYQEFTTRFSGGTTRPPPKERPDPFTLSQALAPVRQAAPAAEADDECVDASGNPLPSWTLTVRSESPGTVKAGNGALKPLSETPIRLPSKGLVKSLTGVRISSAGSQSTQSNRSPPVGSSPVMSPMSDDGQTPTVKRLFSRSKKETRQRRSTLLSFTPIRRKDASQPEQ
ncbi:hypothetical protein HDU80_001993 [Chytriomyces hyalinus]|nr:hypothetical protein HDU80_001993 [Chytriomyces hyalinus]